MRSLKLSGLIRRNPDRPSLKQRAAALRATAAKVLRRPSSEADQSRRVMMAGSLAVVMPLPALAAPATAGPHPDQRVLNLLADLTRAREIEAAAEIAHSRASEVVDAVLADCPLALRPTEWEFEAVSPPFRKPAWGCWMRFRWVPPPSDDADFHWSVSAWTGDTLRTAIAQAVPVLGWGGRTPHRVRRWKALLPVADAFDARVEAVEIANDYRRLRKERDAARKVVSGLEADISRCVAVTPEGMAALVRVIGEYCWKDTGGAWPNLLRSAAVVSGVPLADLEHEYASTRSRRA